LTIDPGQELPNRPIGGATIGCCVCLKVTGQHAPAATIIRGYAVCDAHTVDLSGEFSDFAQLLGRIRADRGGAV